MVKLPFALQNAGSGAELYLNLLLRDIRWLGTHTLAMEYGSPLAGGRRKRGRGLSYQIGNNDFGALVKETCGINICDDGLHCGSRRLCLCSCCCCLFCSDGSPPCFEATPALVDSSAARFGGHDI